MSRRFDLLCRHCDLLFEVARRFDPYFDLASDLSASYDRQQGGADDISSACLPSKQVHVGHKKVDTEAIQFYMQK